MKLIDWFEDNNYIVCRDRAEEKAFILQVDDEGICIHDNIDTDFLHDLRNDIPFGEYSISYPVVYELTDKCVTTTTSAIHMNEAVSYFDISTTGTNAVEVEDLL